jgi:hypothetical protein
MKHPFEDILQEGISACLNDKGISREKANTRQLGKAFAETYFKEIGVYLFSLDEDSVAEGVECDGKGDLNIDFAYEQDNQYIICQFKYKGKNSGVTTDEISGFFNIPQRLLDDDYFQKHANNSLQDTLRDFDKDSQVQFYFITNDKLSDTDTIRDEFNLSKERVESQTENYVFELKSLAELKEDYRIVTSESEMITKEVYINVESLHDTFTSETRQAYLDLSDVVNDNTNYKTIICTISGNMLKSLWREHKSSLFNYNIRGFLGENPINKKIKETIKLEPEKFYFYNNGISAICTDIEPIINNKGILAQFKCSNFQIINGAQTTTTIGKFKDKNSIHLNKVRILLRITKAEDYKKEKGLNKKIVTYNNSQTIIKASDFRSNDDIQIWLEKKLNEFKYKYPSPHKVVLYQRKRIKVNKKKDQLFIPIDNLARALYVFDNDPLLVYKGAKYFFDTDEQNGMYWRIFGDNGTELEYFNDARLTKTIGIFFIWTRIEEKLKLLSKEYKSRNEDTAIAYQATLAKWHFLYIYGYILNNNYSNDLPSIFKKIANGQLFEKKENFIERWFPRIHKLITKCIEQNYQQYIDDNKSITQGFNFKNWLRSNSEFEKLKREIKYIEITDYPLG